MGDTNSAGAVMAMVTFVIWGSGLGAGVPAPDPVDPVDPVEAGLVEVVMVLALVAPDETGDLVLDPQAASTDTARVELTSEQTRRRLMRRVCVRDPPIYSYVPVDPTIGA